MKSPWNPRQEKVWAEFEVEYSEIVDCLPAGTDREKRFADWSTRREHALDQARDAASRTAADPSTDDPIALSSEEAKDSRKYRRARKLAREGDRDLVLDSTTPAKKRPDPKDTIALSRAQAKDASTYRSASERARLEHKILVLVDSDGYII